MFATVVFAGTLAGCDNYVKDYDTNTLIINKNGSLVEVAVEDFQNSSVKEEEINAYIEEQIDAYNEVSGKKVSKKTIDTQDLSKVKLVLKYEDIESYNGFNSLNYKLDDFVNIQESDFKGSYTSSEGEVVGVADFKEIDESKVLMISEATDLVVDGEIQYYNEEFSVKDDIAKSSGNGTAIIIYK